jgi:hypothetical protein
MVVPALPVILSRDGSPMASESKGDVVGDDSLAPDAAEVKAAAEKAASLPNEIAQLRFRAVAGDAAAAGALFAHVKARAMAPLYEVLCAELRAPVDAALLATMRTANAAELAALEAKVADAKEQHGEVELADAIVAKVRARAWRATTARAHARTPLPRRPQSTHPPCHIPTCSAYIPYTRAANF